MKIFKGIIWNKSIKDNKSQKLLIKEYITALDLPLIVNKNINTIVIGKGTKLSHASIIARELDINLIFQPQIVEYHKKIPIKNLKIEYKKEFAYLII